MKIKKFEKKLALNKKTISNLGDPAMDAIKGGLLWESEVDPTECQGGGATDPCFSLIAACLAPESMFNIDTFCF